MNRIPRTTRIPLSSRQAVRLMARPHAPTLHRGDEEESEHEAVDGQAHVFEFDFASPILPAIFDAGAGSSSQKRTLIAHAGKKPRSSSRSRSRSRSVPNDAANGRHTAADRSGTWPSFPLKRISEPQMIAPPTLPPAPYVPDGLHEPVRRADAHVAVERNYDELRHSHPDIFNQLTNGLTVSLLEEEERKQHQENVRLRMAGEFGPEGVEEIRQPVLENGTTLTATWNEEGTGVLLLTTGDEDGSQLYLHELTKSPGQGLARTVHDQPLYNGAERILQVSVCARAAKDSQHAPTLLTVLRTARCTQVWEISRREQAAQPQRLKRKITALERSEDLHPFVMHRVHDLPTYPNPRNAEGQAANSVGPSSVISGSSKGKEKARSIGDEDDEVDETTMRQQPASLPKPPIVNASWHPSDPNQLLTVDAVGRLGIWVYDPGIIKGRHRLVGNDPCPDTQYPIAPGPRPDENNAGYFQVLWTRQRQTAFLISRTRFSAINLKTGFSVVILDLTTAPRVDSVLSRPQFIRALGSYNDTLNRRNLTSSTSDTPDLLAVLSTVELFLWDVSALERFLDEREAAKYQPEADDATRAPEPLAWWEHVRGLDRSLSLSWIPVPSLTTHRSVVLSSTRSRALVVYTVELSRGPKASNGPQEAGDTDDFANNASASPAYKIHIVAPTLLPTTLSALAASQAKRPTGPLPFPRSHNPPLFIRFDRPDDFISAPWARPKEARQMLMVEQDTRSSLSGIICEVVPLPSRNLPSEKRQRKDDAKVEGGSPSVHDRNLSTNGVWNDTSLSFSESPWHQRGAGGGNGGMELLDMNSQRTPVDRDDQRDRNIVDLRQLYRALMQVGIVSDQSRILAAEDVLTGAIKRMRAGEMMNPTPQLPQLFLQRAQQSLPVDVSLLQLCSTTLAGTLATPASLLTTDSHSRELLKEFFSTLTSDMFSFRPFCPEVHAGIELSDAFDGVIDGGGGRAVSLRAWEDLADGIRDLYLGPKSRRKLPSSLFLGIAADQVALDLLLSSTAVSSRQVSIVIDSPRQDNALWVTEEAEKELSERSGVEAVLYKIAKSAGHPTDRLNDSDDEAAEGTASQRHRRAPSQASARSSRIEDLDDKLDRHLDEVEQRHLPDVELPFLAPRLRSDVKKQPEEGKIASIDLPISRAARLLLSDWTIGEKVEISRHRNPYETVPDLDELERDRRSQRATSSQPPPSVRTPSRGQTPVVNHIERWRNSTSASAAALAPSSPGGSQLSQQQYPIAGPPPVGFAPPRIASRLQMPFASQVPDVGNSYGGGGGGGSSQLGPQSQDVFPASMVPGGGASGAMVGSSQDAEANMPSTQPLPGRFADRRTATPAKKKLKKKRAGGF
ncbi:hypothetical protein A4X06_0g3292 [Tilletia controversa]|uniref:Uncharacterized protein n=1 Tax=Tilletia controversa TaxID=13291 RepID=A0A8X7SYA7_9BASI|nr:hypothetical protein CF328_g2498 [Tilletia controversa]KAE8249310.1 hypothetical protein A4X06_0g3292 [Tilletia controversa]